MYPRILPEFLHLGPFEVLGRTLGPLYLNSFGLMLALAFILAGHVYAIELERRRLDPELAGVVVTWAIVGALVGARLYYLIEFWDEVRGDLAGAAFSGSGLVAYGGFAGGIALSWFALRRHRAPVLTASDAAAPSMALGYAIGRVGCLLAGDGDYGPPTDLPWGLSFAHGVIPPSEHPALRHLGTVGAVHPTPLYEIVMILIVFAILWRLRTRPWAPGRLFALYLSLQGAERFCAEFLRLNPAWMLGMSGAQIIGALSFVGGLLWWIRLGGSARGAG